MDKLQTPIPETAQGSDLFEGQTLGIFNILLTQRTSARPFHG